MSVADERCVKPSIGNMCFCTDISACTRKQKNRLLDWTSTMEGTGTITNGSYEHKICVKYWTKRT